VRKGALRRPTEASPPHLTPPLLTLSTNAAQTAADGSATAGCSTGATEPGFSPAPNRWEIIISPLLRCRDPSITPRYPCVPYLTVTPSPAQPSPGRCQTTAAKISCWFGIGIGLANYLAVISVYRDIDRKTVSVVHW